MKIPSRSTVPDVLRGIAIVMMLIAHAMPFVPHIPILLKKAVTATMMGQPMFALVMGMSLQLFWQRRLSVGHRDGTPRAKTIATVLLQQYVRAAALIALGYWLSSWGSWVAIVLAYLGVALLIAAPLLLLPSRWLIPVGVVFFALIQPVTTIARERITEVVPQSLTYELWRLIGAGNYHPVMFVTLMIVGALLVRQGFQRDRIFLIVGSAALVMYVIGAYVKMLGFARGGTYLDSMRDIGVVLVTYTIVVLIVGSKIRPVLTPLADLGRVSLSIYVAHVAFIAWYARTYGYPTSDVLWAWAICVPGMVLLGIAWWRLVGMGPFEWALNLVMGRPRHPRSAIRAARERRATALSNG